MNGIDFLKELVQQNLINHKIQSGQNGPYNDPETPVRNNAHWLITLCRLYEFTNEEKYLTLAEKNLEVLTSDKYLPHSKAYWHRTKSGKDSTNGLIGQAWSIEGLLYAANYFNKDELQKTATDLFLMHPFDKKKGLWKRIECNGTPLGFDPAFNHQLWFASSACQIQNEQIQKQIEIFLTKVPETLELYPEGLIFHLLKKPLNFKDLIYKTLLKKPEKFSAILPGKTIQKFVKLKEATYQKSIGYHAFNMFAFALLKKQYPQHSFWNSSNFRTTLSYINSDTYKKAIQNEDIYGFPYNPPGFEVPFCLYMFNTMEERQLTEEATWWLNAQITKTFDSKGFKFNNNTSDPDTLTARVYELSQWPEFLLKIVNIPDLCTSSQ